MNISLIATTHKDYVAKKSDFDYFSGLCAGVCYMPNDFKTLSNENEEKTIKRMLMTKNNGHHSVFDHCYMSLYLENIPKILAMIINNEKMYTTSEKSGRYTQMKLPDDEQKLYDKWLVIFKDAIEKTYEKNKFFTDNRILKLAQENARYVTSIFTPVSMVYSVSYRQLNYLYGFFKGFIAEKHKSVLKQRIAKELEDFCKELEKLGYIDEILQNNNKQREISLFAKRKNVKDYFGEVYVTSYKGTLSQFAQAQRHRTLDMSIAELSNFEIYVPKIIRNDEDLVKEWKEDILSLKDSFPQAQLYKIIEKGTLDNFILKSKERLCSFAQLEIHEQTYKTMQKYANFLKKNDAKLYKVIANYNKTSRCQFPKFKCTSPCGYVQGIKCDRLI